MFTIYCDESGYTGNNLLEVNQRYFVYAGVKITDAEKSEIINFLRSSVVVQSKEIKARNLLSSERGQAAIASIVDKFKSNARIVYAQKPFALACKIVDYTIESLLDTNSLFYQSGFNRYAAHVLFREHGELMTESKFFQYFQQCLTGVKSPIDLDTVVCNDPISSWLLHLAATYAEQLQKENDPDSMKRYILDLTTSSLQTILSDWGKEREPIKVICDRSNLFKDNMLIEGLNHIGRHGRRAEFLGSIIGFDLSQDIVCMDSKNEEGLQIADVFSSTVSWCLQNPEKDFSEKILKQLNTSGSICLEACVEYDEDFAKDENIKYISAFVMTRLDREILRKHNVSI